MKMTFPNNVDQCVQMLEAHGYCAYAVGGCVRDACLGLEPQDYDLCTCALPEQTEQVFSGFSLVLAGKKHGTVGVISEGQVIEITTFRTDGAYLDNRHPEQVQFVSRVEDDLARRDFTVNAMAYSPTRGFADPFGGREDLKNRILRAVGDPMLRFREDSLRILRGMRFAVRFGLTPEQNTLEAMFRLAPLMDNLARERVFSELCKVLPLVDVGDLKTFAPILTQVIPELAPTLNFDQRNPHHAHDLFTHIAHTVALTPKDVTLRWAALLHDVGKIPCFTLDEQGIGHFHGHADVSAQMADEILLRLKAPTQLRQDVGFLIEKHMNPAQPDRKLLRRWISRFGAERTRMLLQLQRADVQATIPGREENFPEIFSLFEEILAENACLSLKDLAINGHDLMALGFRGPSIGACLNQLLTLVVQEQLPNHRQTLLDFARREFPL